MSESKVGKKSTLLQYLAWIQSNATLWDLVQHWPLFHKILLPFNSSHAQQVLEAKELGSEIVPLFTCLEQHVA